MTPTPTPLPDPTIPFSGSFGIVMLFLLLLLAAFFAYMWNLQRRYFDACKEKDLALYSRSAAGLPTGTVGDQRERRFTKSGLRWRAPGTEVMTPRTVRGALLVVACLTLVACAVRQLDQFKDKSAAGDFAWIARETVVCDEQDDVCGQLHLIKGDACFRLAKQGAEPARNYPCAANELEKGIALTTTWRGGELNLDRAQTYANLCEALRQWQDLERGAQAEQLSRQLLDASGRFLAAEPGNPAGVYYAAVARYALLQPAIVRGDNPAGVCAHLNTVLHDLGAAAPRARGGAYEASISRLQEDLSGVMRTVPDCASSR